MPWLRVLAALVSVSLHAGVIAAVVAHRDHVSARPAEVAVTVSFETAPMEAVETSAGPPQPVAPTAAEAAEAAAPAAELPGPPSAEPGTVAETPPAATATAAPAGAPEAPPVPTDAIGDAGVGSAPGPTPAATIAADQAPAAAQPGPAPIADEAPPAAPPSAAVLASDAALLADAAAAPLDAVGPPIASPPAAVPAVDGGAPEIAARPSLPPPTLAAVEAVPAAVAGLDRPPPEAEAAGVEDARIATAAPGIAPGSPAPIAALSASGPVQTSDVVPPDGRVASLQAAPSLDRVRDFVEHYDGGRCFFASVAGTTGDAPAIDSFSPTVDPMMAFDAAFLGALGVDPRVTGQRVWSAQCPVVDFLRATRSVGGSPPLSLHLNRRDLRAGDMLDGTIAGAAAAQVGLFLVSETGAVEDVSDRLLDRAGVTVFAVPLRGAAQPGPLPEVLVAVERRAGPRPAASAARADALFPALRTASASDGLALRSAAMMFLLHE